MTQEFIPYAEALALKELGFDEPCLGVYYESKTFYSYTKSKGVKNSDKTSQSWVFTAPLYQQSFRWFREKYGLYADIYRNSVKFNACIEDLITGNSKETVTDNGVEYEEAELACLKRLIEIVKIK
jgi:hypothetical protein